MDRHEELCAILRARSTVEPSRVLDAVRAREAEIQRLAQRRSGIEHTTLVCGFVALLVCAIVLTNPMVIGACVLYVAAAIPYALGLRRHGRTRKAPAAEASMVDQLAHYRAELERERGMVPRTIGYAVPLVGATLLAYVGLRSFLGAQGMPVDVVDTLFAWFGGASVVMIAGGGLVAVRERRKLGREIAALKGAEAVAG